MHEEGEPPHSGKVSGPPITKPESRRTQTMSNVAFYAHLDHTEGIALRADTDRVFFIDHVVGVWTELFDRDMPRLVLNGHLPTADAQALADGNLVRRASQTLQEVRV